MKTDAVSSHSQGSTSCGTAAEKAAKMSEPAGMEFAVLPVNSDSNYLRCRNRFNTKWSANDYANKHVTSRKHKKEIRCIQAALSDLPQGALILDIPCGVGRLTCFLHDLGYHVVGADYSHFMIQTAQKKSPTSPTIRFEEQEVLAITHADKTFDAVLCNRLFHHYPTSDVRRQALRELARVCKGPLVVSFFNSYCLSAQWHKLRKMFQANKSLDRLPISYHIFKQDVEACDLAIESTYYCSLGISPQTYVRIVRPE